jgi:hypothetical protein
MKTKIRLTVSFIVGLLLGLGIMCVLMGINARRIMAHYASVQLGEMAMNARQLRSGQVEAILKRYDESLPTTVMLFEKEHAKFLDDNQRIGTLWAVQRYYSDNPSLSIPEDTKAILDSLPPRPLTKCELDATSSTRQAK